MSLQKANFWKRISAYLLDTVATVFFALGFLILFLAVFGYDGYSKQYAEKEQVYYTQYAEEYGVDFTITQEEYDALSSDEKRNYDAALSAAQTAIEQDAALMQLANKLFALVLISSGIGLFFSLTIFHFIIPLCLKNGQTLGKKVFGLAVMRTNCVKISAPVLFVRAIIGLFVMETAAPLLLCLMGSVGVIAAILVVALQCFVMWRTETNSSIHDLLSDTVVVDFASQRIFDTQEEMLSFRQKELEEKQNAQTQENKDEPSL